MKTEVSVRVEAIPPEIIKIHFVAREAHMNLFITVTPEVADKLAEQLLKAVSDQALRKV